MNRLNSLRRLLPVVVLAPLLAATLGVGEGRSESYPDRPVKIIVPTPPGGPVDVIARIAGELSAGQARRAVRGREPRRRRQYHRLEGRRRGDAGRLYAALFGRERADHRAAVASRCRLRPAEELCAGRAGRRDLAHPRGQSAASGQERAGTRRLRQSQSGQSELFLRRHRRAAAFDRRTVQGARRHRHRARALQRRRSLDQRCGGRQCADDLRGDQRAHAADQGRPAACTCGHLGATDPGIARVCRP